MIKRPNKKRIIINLQDKILILKSLNNFINTILDKIKIDN